MYLFVLVGVVAVVWSMAGVEALLPRQGELEPAMACRPRRRSLAGLAGVGERAVAGDWPGVGRWIEPVGYLGDGGEEPESSIHSWLPFRLSQSRP